MTDDEVELATRVMRKAEGGDYACPVCGEGSPVFPDMEVIGGRLYQDVRCTACGKEWTLGYTLDSVSFGASFISPDDEEDVPST